MNRVVHDLYHGVQHATLLESSLNLASALSCNYDPRGELLFVGTSSDEVLIFDVQTKFLRARLPRAEFLPGVGGIVSVSCTLDQQWVLSSSTSGLLTLYHLPSLSIHKQILFPCAIQWSQIAPNNHNICIVSPVNPSPTCLVNLSLENHQVVKKIHTAHGNLHPKLLNAWLNSFPSRFNLTPLALQEMDQQETFPEYFGAQLEIPTEGLINNKEVVTFATFSPLGDKIAFGTAHGLVFVADITYTDVFSSSDANKQVLASPLSLPNKSLTPSFFPRKQTSPAGHNFYQGFNGIRISSIQLLKYPARAIRNNSKVLQAQFSHQRLEQKGSKTSNQLLAVVYVDGIVVFDINLRDNVMVMKAPNEGLPKKAVFSPLNNYLYIFLIQEQHTVLVKSLEDDARPIEQLIGPVEGCYDIASHPLLPMIASVPTTGRVLWWIGRQRESWTSFNPVFQELEDNVEHIELEHDFDQKIHPTHQGNSQHAYTTDWHLSEVPYNVKCLPQLPLVPMFCWHSPQYSFREKSHTIVPEVLPATHDSSLYGPFVGMTPPSSQSAAPHLQHNVPQHISTSPPSSPVFVSTEGTNRIFPARPLIRSIFDPNTHKFAFVTPQLQQDHFLKHMVAQRVIARLESSNTITPTSVREQFFYQAQLLLDQYPITPALLAERQAAARTGLLDAHRRHIIAQKRAQALGASFPASQAVPPPSTIKLPYLYTHTSLHPAQFIERISLRDSQGFLLPPHCILHFLFNAFTSAERLQWLTQCDVDNFTAVPIPDVLLSDTLQALRSNAAMMSYDHVVLRNNIESGIGAAVIRELGLNNDNNIDQETTLGRGGGPNQLSNPFRTLSHISVSYSIKTMLKQMNAHSDTPYPQAYDEFANRVARQTKIPTRSSDNTDEDSDESVHSDEDNECFGTGDDHNDELATNHVDGMQIDETN